MEIVKKGKILVIGTRSISVDQIKYIDHDEQFVYVGLESPRPGIMRPNLGFVIPFGEVTAPQAFGSAAELQTYLDSFRNQTGIVNGTKTIALSDDTDCVEGYIRVKAKGTGGTIKYTTVDGDIDDDTFTAGETSTFRVKRVWVTVTDVAVADIRILN